MDGLKVMLVGMSVVFLMLMFIVIAIPISARIIRYFEGPTLQTQQARQPGVEKNPGVIAAIAAAIARFRNND